MRGRGTEARRRIDTVCACVQDIAGAGAHRTGRRRPVCHRAQCGGTPNSRKTLPPRRGADEAEAE
jgi:hypothetical protein